MATKTRKVNASVEDAVGNAFSEMESIKDELQEWYDNLPENFQNGDKGSQIQEAVDTLERALDQPDIPDAASELACDYAEYFGKIGRPKRRDTAVNAVRAAADACDAEVERLNTLSFEPDDETPDPETTEVVNGSEEAEVEEAMTEDERDTAVQELEELANACNEAADEWDGVEFPGMYG